MHDVDDAIWNHTPQPDTRRNFDGSRIYLDIWHSFPIMGTAARTSPADVERYVLAALRAAWESSDPPVTQRELHKRTGVSQAQVSKMLAGKKGGTITEVDALCTALGLDFAQVAADSTAQVRADLAALTDSPAAHLSNISDPAIRAAIEAADAQEAANRRRKGQPNG